MDSAKDFFKNVLMFIFLTQRETDYEWRGAERGRHRILSRLHALSCLHRAQRGARTHGLPDHDLSQSRTLNQPSHPGTRQKIFKI